MSFKRERRDALIRIFSRIVQGVAVLGFAVAILAVKRASRARVVKPYLSGVQLAESGIFIGPMNQPVKAEAKNYYLSSIFGEKKLTIWINLAAGVLLTLMAGGTL